MTTGTGFNFRSGNAGKLLALPLYVLGWLVSLVVPRQQQRWVFGCGSGIGEGALPVYREVQRRLPNDELTWIVTSETQQREAQAQNIRWVKRDSWAGFWCTLRAGTIVVTHGFGDVNRFGIFGGFVVQLWHGIPLKKLHLDTEVTLATKPGFSGLLRSMYRRGGQSISMFVVASSLVGERIRRAFNIPSSVLAPIGDPRDDALIHSNHTEARDALRRVLGTALDHSKLVLYAPTWRDGGADPGVPTAADWAAIDEWAETMDARLVIRAHPLGAGSYQRAIATRVHELPASVVADVTPLLGAFDAVVTDYSSLAFDFSLTGKPIVWFAPDREAYERSRGFYESYDALTDEQWVSSWAETLEKLTDVLTDPATRQRAERASVELAERLFAERDGQSAARVVSEILRRRGAEVTARVFFESFYGRQVSCNPRALDAELARLAPSAQRIWSVEHDDIDVPPGAIKVVRGSDAWRAARERADLLIVNDWLGRDFRPKRHQVVLQTWHGTMLKRLALERPKVSLRTRLAIHRESRKWDILLSQNTHCTKHLRSSYAYRGPVWQVGYPRNDSLANPDRAAARARLNIPEHMRVLVYAPTWRTEGQRADVLDVATFAAELPTEWMLLVRGHSRTFAAGGYLEVEGRLRDVSAWPDVNDVLLAADLFVTDYSSLMFDASVARIPMAFFVPDLDSYRDAERGFTFDFEQDAPGPFVQDRSALLALIERLDEWPTEYRQRYDDWRHRFNAHDDGAAANRVVQRLIADGYLRPSRGR